jgi:hypothetical protein
MVFFYGFSGSMNQTALGYQKNGEKNVYFSPF